jgi:hypothetical protein
VTPLRTRIIATARLAFPGRPTFAGPSVEVSRLSAVRGWQVLQLNFMDRPNLSLTAVSFKKVAARSDARSVSVAALLQAVKQDVLHHRRAASGQKQKRGNHKNASHRHPPKHRLGANG